MRKLITLFSAISLLYSSVSTIIACGVGDGNKTTVNFGNVPLKKTPGTDPLVDYVYDDYYKYDTDALYKPLAAFMQLAADKIRIDRSILDVSNLTHDFYNSTAYKSGDYESINYDSAKVLNRPFSYADNIGTPLVFGLTDDDISKQQTFGYWYVTYNTATAAENPTATDKTSITVPKINEFNADNKKTIIRQGWIHLFFTMKDSKINKTFKIDFNIEIDVSFILHVDTNKREIVVVAPTTITNALGDVDFHHPEWTFDDYDGKPGRIDNMSFTEI